MAQEIVLKSGAKLEVTVSEFQKAKALQDALLRAAKGAPLSSEFLEQDLGALKDLLIQVATSEEVDKALFACLEKCSYKGVRVTRALFDDKDLAEEARADFYDMAWNVVKVNCGPFFKQALSLLKASQKTPAAGRK